jgi:hypothetical protein
MELDEDKLTELAEQIKESFCRRKDPSGAYRANSEAHDIRFRKAAELCHKLNAEPTEFISAQFNLRDPDGVYATHLAGDNARKNYVEYMKTYYIEPHELYEVNLRNLHNQIRQGRKVESILMNDDLNFPGWFRICITLNPEPAIIKKYRAQAKEELTPKLIAFIRSKKMDPGRIEKQ